MYLTEAEAGNRRCQEAYSGAPQSAGPMAASVAGATVVNHSPLYCIGSACMAWRWRSHAHPLGYCGKAGKP